MSIFFNAYFLKTQQPPIKLKEKFSQFERIPNSDWIVCDFGDSLVDGAFEGEEYLTQELSEIFGEVIFIAIDTSNDQLDYEHSLDGEVLRKLTWLSDGCQSTWVCVEGELEDWEITSVFSSDNLNRTRDLLSYDRHLNRLPADEIEVKEQELQSLWRKHEYVLNGQIPLGDATFGFIIQRHFFGITTEA
ncbi:hypothetical protein H6F42_15620 [Pseudanabaena sp. FACHB-1998]|uniref:hypothetical protein n=1 Tax=Pseudanabaena sp. FACHB-1998 TaxID=2692858 RepID=UPI001681193D|nr:hypothetical protein [Pseudanabaena sp. FACHB-1998]MBD2178347.1 hypothetical protein [Pseudanabaena sp. FACHB-1998]